MKKLISLGLVAALLCTSALASNPEITETEPGQRVYCGAPAALVVDTDGDGEGDKVYLYEGEDTGSGAYYSMPNYLCYSTTDMVNWIYEGIPLRTGDFSWGSSNDAWAAQVIEYNGKYYFYNSKNSTGMSVAVSDSPTTNTLRLALTQNGSGAEKNVASLPGICDGEYAALAITVNGSEAVMYQNGIPLASGWRSRRITVLWSMVPTAIISK